MRHVKHSVASHGIYLSLFVMAQETIFSQRSQAHQRSFPSVFANPTICQTSRLRSIFFRIAFRRSALSNKMMQIAPGIVEDLLGNSFVVEKWEELEKIVSTFRVFICHIVYLLECHLENLCKRLAMSIVIGLEEYYLPSLRVLFDRHGSSMANMGACNVDGQQQAF